MNLLKRVWVCAVYLTAKFRVSDHNLRLMRLDARELGIKSPNGINGGTHHAKRFRYNFY